MSEGAKDYLGWKLSEKVAFLVLIHANGELHNNGMVDHILIRSKEDKASLDIHIEQLRYP